MREVSGQQLRLQFRLTGRASYRHVSYGRTSHERASYGRASHERLMCLYPIGMHLMGVYLMGVYHGRILSPAPVKMQLGFLSVKLLGKGREN